MAYYLALSFFFWFQVSVLIRRTIPCEVSSEPSAGNFRSSVYRFVTNDYFCIPPQSEDRVDWFIVYDKLFGTTLFLVKLLKLNLRIFVLGFPLSYQTIPVPLQVIARPLSQVFLQLIIASYYASVIRDGSVAQTGNPLPSLNHSIHEIVDFTLDGFSNFALLFVVISFDLLDMTFCHVSVVGVGVAELNNSGIWFEKMCNYRAMMFISICLINRKAMMSNRILSSHVLMLGCFVKNLILLSGLGGDIHSTQSANHRCITLVITASFLFTITTYDYLLYRPSLKDSVDWFIFNEKSFNTNLQLNGCARSDVTLFFFTGYPYFGCRVELQVKGVLFTPIKSVIDDSFIRCIRYTRRLCSKNMKSLALTELTDLLNCRIHLGWVSNFASFTVLRSSRCHLLCG